MEEILAIVWGDNSLELFKVPRAGVWTTSLKPVQTVELIRPANIASVEDGSLKTGLASALRELATKVNSKDVWMLIPQEWVQRFKFENPNLSNEVAQREHIIWEVEQRELGSINDYRLLIPTDTGNQYITVSLVRLQLYQCFIDAARQAEISLKGIGISCRNGETYSFEKQSNFLQAELPQPPRHLIPTGFKENRRGIIIAAAIALVVVVVVVTMKIYNSGQMFSNIFSGAQVQDSTALNTDSLLAIDSIKKFNDLDSALYQATMLAALLKVIPDSAEIHLATMSPADFKAEVSGITDPESWLRDIQKYRKFQPLGIAGRFLVGTDEHIILRVEPSGWATNNTPGWLKSWQSKAASYGLTGKGRSATGNKDSVLSLTNAVQASPNGVTKILVSGEQDQWTITVQ